MIGTLVNTAAVAAGGALGLIIGKGMKGELAGSCLKAMGAATMFIGLGGALESMLSVGADGAVTCSGSLLLLISLALGAAVGELLRISDRVESLSGALEKKLGLKGFAKGFVEASVLFCAGAMTIVGSFNDGLYGDSSILVVKSVMDFVSSVLLASTLGVGVMCSAAFVFVYQGALTLCAGLLEPVMSESVMSAVGMTGYAIVAVIGLNLMDACRIKTANLVPALVFAAAIRALGWL